MEAPLRIAELESRPLSTQLTADSTYELLRRAAEAHRDAPALAFRATGAPDDPIATLSYLQLLQRIRQTANAFAELGIGPDDVVSTLLPNLLETHEIFWGAQAAGIVNPINFLLRTQEIVQLLNAARARVLVTVGPHPSINVWPKVQQIMGQVPSLKHVVQIPLDGSSTPAGTDESHVLDFRQIRDAQPSDRLVFDRRIQATDIAAYFHTGGTTGSPKLARHTHGNEVFTAWAFGQLFELSADDIVLNGLPMFHVAGTLVCTLAPLAAGASVVILSAAGMRHPTIVANYWRLVEHHRATIIGGVPTALASLNGVPIDGASLESANVAITGASPLPLEVGRRFEALTGKPVHEILGMTETAGLLALNPRHSPRMLGSAGYRLPFTKMEVRPIVDGELSDQPCAPGQSGVLVIQGPNVFPGYVDPQHNQNTLTRDGFLITGDLGYMESDGRLFLTGRAKDVIIRGGHNIDPVWIESAAESHPDVHLAVAVGQPDAYAGEVPVLFVTAQPGAQLESDEIQAFVREHIAEPPAYPKKVFVIDELPMTVVGKPFRPELRRRAAELRLREALEQAQQTLGGEAGAPSKIDLDVELHPGGLKAHVRVDDDAEPLLQTIRETLERFAVRYAIEILKP